MNEQRFKELSQQGYNRIPVYKSILADLDTPLSTYLKLADQPYSCLFESVQGGEKWGRYSIIGLPSNHRLEVAGHQVSEIVDGETVRCEAVADPLVSVDEFYQRYNVPHVEGIAHLPRFTGGLVGYFGYDTVRYVEPKLGECPNKDEMGVPDILLMLCDQVVVFDNLAGKIYLIVHADPSVDGAYENAVQQLADLTQRLRTASTDYHPEKTRRHVGEDDFVSGFTQEGFEEAVERIKQYVIDGDVMQVVPSQRLSVPFEGAPLDVYRALRLTNPSPYMFLLNLGDFHVVGSSPEILVRQEEDSVTVRPIAGTRRRGYTPEEDLALEEELLADEKEIAEHLMLIDLGRNDIGRVCQVGSVELTEQMIIERYSHVMHIVSNVTGKVREDKSLMDILRATFPAGTLSGAPKIRAMEIIDELEPVKRGIYGGAVGYLSWSGNMDLAIAIRTLVVKDQTLYVQAGAGVVADSIPRLEWKETMNKARTVFNAVAMAERGLDDLNEEGES